MDYLKLFHGETPEFLRRLADTPPMRRLADVGMNCGCEYTSFPRFREIEKYTRLYHSLGTGLIVWHFTRDEKQAAAGLLHDVATPAFAHVVDFLHGDYLTQESTEDDTERIIAQSAELVSVLREYGLTVDDVKDYHLYPVADNDSPRLSADRLEYTIGNGLNYGVLTTREAKRIYDDLTVCRAEDGQTELCFRSPGPALRFARCALSCGKIYVSDEDRYAMQMLAELLKDAIAAGVLAADDLWKTESAVLRKLTADPAFREKWERFRAYRTIHSGKSGTPPADAKPRVIDAKKRRIDPYVAGMGRVSAFSPEFRKETQAYLDEDFSAAVWAF